MRVVSITSPATARILADVARRHGGGLLTVLTAAIKMRIVDASLPPFIEGFASGTNYAVSFVLLQVFGLVLATKQPAATAATFAGIVRDYRGAERSSKIADFVSRITSTQLAAAIGNVFAVSAGALVFERLWVLLFAHSYLPEESAVHVYQTLHPFESKTALYAIITGLILWMAALIGGWCDYLPPTTAFRVRLRSIPWAIASVHAGW